MTTPAAAPKLNVLASMLAAVVLNFTMAFGVWKLGWPKGNIFVLFWVENVIVGIFGYVRIVTAKLPSPQGSAFYLGKQFAMYYGIFCITHGFFTLKFAPRMGVKFMPMVLLVSVVLITFRYLAELVTTWFATKQNLHHSPSDVFRSPYRRIWVLHLGIIATGFLHMYDFVAPSRGHVVSFWDSNTAALSATLVLLALKTISDLRSIWADAHGLSLRSRSL